MESQARKEFLHSRQYQLLLETQKWFGNTSSSLTFYIYYPNNLTTQQAILVNSFATFIIRFHPVLLQLYNMSISLILIAAISVIVMLGIGMLLKNKTQELNDQKKSKLLTIIGSVIFLSFIITTFKHRMAQFNFNQPQPNQINMQKVFFGDRCHFSLPTKFTNISTIPVELINEVYSRNYKSLLEYKFDDEDKQLFIKKQQEIIVYKSQPAEGATYFLKYLAQDLCQHHKIPVIYLKLEKQIVNEESLLKRIGVLTFEGLQSAMCKLSDVEIKKTNKGIDYIKHFSTSKKRPYLIIDNFQYILNAVSNQLSSQEQIRQGQSDEKDYRITWQNKYSQQRLVFHKIIEELVQKCGINLILNSEKENAVRRLIGLWGTQNQIKTSKEKQRLLPFEVHQWQSLNQYDIFKILSKQFPNEESAIGKMLQFNKKQKYNFQDLSNFVNELDLWSSQSEKERQLFKISAKVSKQEVALKDANMKLNVAQYFGLEKAYRCIKSSESKKVGQIKNRVRLSQLFELQDLGLLQIIEGDVVLL